MACLGPGAAAGPGGLLPQYSFLFHLGELELTQGHRRPCLEGVQFPFPFQGGAELTGGSRRPWVARESAMLPGKAR